MNKLGRSAQMAFVMVFFDADMWCPRQFCPANMSSNEASWKEACMKGRLPRRGPKFGRPHWKPIIAPRRTWDVSVHLASAIARPMSYADLSVEQFITRPCLWHQGRPKWI